MRPRARKLSRVELLPQGLWTDEGAGTAHSLVRLAIFIIVRGEI